jgi:methionyl-tRNA synthetase
VPASSRFLVTTALPYANGPLHLGHLLETIQADIWVRYLRLAGRSVVFVCADDAHGTPIMLKAAQDRIPPEQLIASVRAEHLADFNRFGISFDHYHSTHSPENQALVLRFYEALKEGHHLLTRRIHQMYDPEAGLFLPDRYIRGTCPRCGATDQYGDNCEVCGASYSPSELVSPRSILSGKIPELRETEHVFVRLEGFRERLQCFVHEQVNLDRGVAKKLDEWLGGDLRDWDITRDEPYFGFPIPDRTRQFFYVWLDAPIGYLASFRAWTETHPGTDFGESLEEGSPIELYHFLGKDIIYFHGLFWPALLSAAGFRLPNGLFVHGFLTVNGQKMSKSRGTFLTARDFAETHPPEALRYYFATKLGAGIEDLDLDLADLRQRFNADLVGKFINLAARSSPFLDTGTGSQLSSSLPDPDLYDQFRKSAETIRAAYEGRDFSRALRTIMDLADQANQYFTACAPWTTRRESPERARDTATETLNLFRLLAGCLKPVLPELTGRIEAWLGTSLACWEDLDRPLLGRALPPYFPLLTRLSESPPPASPRSLLPNLDSTSTPDSPMNQTPDPIPPIDIHQFNQVNLRVARILAAERVEGSDKLLRLRVSLGDEERTVFAGIQKTYAPETLVGRLTVVVANLAPRKMRFGVSEAMVLAASDGATGPFLLSPDSGATPGMVVR